MPAPELRFEVPPEYAEVYERAYRRAYEEGQGKLGSTADDAPRSAQRGKRAAIPEQRRTSREETRGRAGGARARRVGPVETEPADGRARHGHRADRRAGSTVLPLLGLAGLMALMLIGAFILGRVTATTVSTGAAQTGAGPGATASATEGLSSASPSPAPYDGPTRLARVAAVDTSCTAQPTTDAAGQPVDWSAANTVDGNPTTAWRCDGLAVGQVLTYTFTKDFPVVQVGIVPGLAGSDPSTGADEYSAYNRVTKVAWIFDDGTTVTQSLGNNPDDQSERVVPVPPTTSGKVRLKILAVAKGQVDATVLSTVELFTPAK